MDDKSGKENSVGLYGTYPTGEKIARDGETIMEDDIRFGQEWQVDFTRPNLFHRYVGPQYPEKCAMPTLAKKRNGRRRLGASSFS